MSSGFGAKEAKYNTRLAKGHRDQINLCGDCGTEIGATELLCKTCRGTLGPAIEEGSDRRFWGRDTSEPTEATDRL